MGNSLYGVWRVCVNHNVVVCCSPVFVAVECTDGDGVLSVGAGWNNLLNFPPPLSAVTYVLLSAWALWGVVRTNANDR